MKFKTGEAQVVASDAKRLASSDKTVTGGQPLWRLTFGTGRPVVNRTPDGQGACCRSHENPHQHVMFTRFLLSDGCNYRKAIAMVKSV
jgi:hypothetical protein